MALVRRWAVPQSAFFFCISYRLREPGILLMCLSVPFLILPKASNISGTVVVLKCYIFSISISRSFHLKKKKKKKKKKWKDLEIEIEKM